MLTADEQERLGKIILKIAHAFHAQWPLLDPDDLVQRGWRVVIRSCLPRFSTRWKTKITTFCYRAVKNEFINYMHQQDLHQKRYGHELTDVIIDQTPAPMQPEAQIEYRDLLETSKQLVSPLACTALSSMQEDVYLTIVSAVTMLKQSKRDSIRLCKEISDAIQRTNAE